MTAKTLIIDHDCKSGRKEASADHKARKIKDIIE
tara:strand:+ start:787 stop:888 length:102 start_codon:yes stop_codon:yes gene_type:complete